MLSKVRSVISGRQPSGNEPHKVGLVVDMADSHLIGGLFPVTVGPDKQEYPYSRPEFLHFAEEDVALALDQQVRPVLCPKFPNRMPAFAGYAECCNAGKSTLNEDQATAKILQFHQLGYEAESTVVIDDKNKKSKKPERKKSDEDVLSFSPSLSSDDSPSIPQIKAAFFGLFDGHAGSGAASISANCLHEHIKNKVNEVVETVLALSARESHYTGKKAKKDDLRCNPIDSQSLIIGAIEKAFLEMDDQIAEEKQYVRIGGGCAVLIALFCLNKIFIANAGDCRAVYVSPRDVRQVSEDMTPVRERKRLQFLAFNNEDALNNSFSRLEYSRFLTHKDLGQKVLYRDYYMDGWTTKTVKEYDLRPPLISTRSRKARLLNTIGVSRGFGDHHLMTYDDKINIKPFLSASPEVTVLDLSTLEELTDSDVLVMASDGLWDVLSNEDVAKIVRTTLSQTDPSDLTRYTTVAQDLAAAARGNPMEGCKWRLTWNKDDNIEHVKESPATSSTSYGTQASLDDISVLVIPIKFATNLPRDEDDEDDEELLVF